MSKRGCDCTRRSFLSGSGLTLAGFSLMSLLPGPLVRHVMAGTGATNKRMLFVFLRGGNDGINAVIPHGDPDYNLVNRPTLYISPTESIDLTGFASLHPALAEMKQVYDTGQLAVMHRVGYPGSSHSHFDGQRIWENGNPDTPDAFDGWLARYIRESAISQGVQLPVLTAQATPPVLLRGDEPFVNIANPDDFDFIYGQPKQAKFLSAWASRFTDLSSLEPYRPLLSDTGIKLFDILDEYRSWDQASWDPKDPDNPANSLFPVSAATNPDDPAGPNGKKFAADSYDFFKSLKLCALSLLEDAGTRIAGTELNGWDLHDGQGTLGGEHATLLSWLSYGMRSLQLVLSGAAIDDRSYASVWQETIVTTMSEFGRTSKENLSLGTDHANASCMFLAGGNVNGGVYNCDSAMWPVGVMFGIDGRYLLERTDYRSVFWEILRDHLGAAPTMLDTIFPGYESLGLGQQELGLLQGA